MRGNAHASRVWKGAGMSVWPSKEVSAFLTLTLLTTVLLVGAPPDAAAQAGQAGLTGEVRDSSGAGVAKASITVTQTEMGEVTTLSSGKDGVYTLTNLRPGLYTVAVEMQGFRRFVQEGVRLTTGERIRLDVTLTVGGINDEVKVSGDASLLRAETGRLRQG